MNEMTRFSSDTTQKLQDICQVVEVELCLLQLYS